MFVNAARSLLGTAHAIDVYLLPAAVETATCTIQRDRTEGWKLLACDAEVVGWHGWAQQRNALYLIGIY